jgi:hypothetical protein
MMSEQANALANTVGQPELADTYANYIKQRSLGVSEKTIDTPSYDIYRRPLVLGLRDDNNELNLLVHDADSEIKHNENAWEWPVSGLCYAFPDNLRFSFLMEHGFNPETSISNYNDLDTIGFISGDVMRTKSFYDANYEMATSGYLDGMGTETIGVQRQYFNVAGEREQCWMRYKEIRDYDYNNTEWQGQGASEELITKYDMAERVAGLYKYRSFSGNKSAFY